MTALHTLNNRSKGVQPNGSPCVNNHCSTRYEQSSRHNKHTHTNQKVTTLLTTLFNIYTDHHSEHRFRSWPTQMTSPSHLHTQARVQSINTYSHTYIKFLPKQNNLTLNPDKTTCTLFTPDPAEYKNNLDLKINNTVLPMTTHPKVMGLTLGPKLSYNTHIHNISVQAHKPL